MPRVNVSPTKAREFKPLLAGEYEVEIGKAELGTSPKGNTTLKLGMVVLDGPEQEGGESPAGRNISTTIWVDETSGSLKNALESFGVSNDETGWDSDDFIKSRAIAKVKQKMYDGEITNEVRKFRKIEEDA